ncbi:MAG: ribbon-helix-helix domain-containing protein [Candidatus Eiseniibacteriota bacterium]|jgi:hypothetical protein
MALRKAFLLRVTPELHEALEKWAADELRSVNGQIEYLLSQAVKQAGRERRRARTGPENDESRPQGSKEETS